MMSPSSNGSRIGRNLLYIVYLMVVCFILFELILRAYFAFQTGPRTLLYGTDWHRNYDPSGEIARRNKFLRDHESELSKHLNAEEREDSVEKHLNQRSGYTKFYPNEHKTTRDVDTGERIPVSINSQGFRGPEFELEKPDNVARVLTLGASSTFGFYDRDDETYPYYLQLILNEKCTNGPRFEVINFGIPHSSSSNLAALFLAEGISLNPDVVTFYQGRNDSVWTSTTNYRSLSAKLYSIAVHRFITVALLDQILVGDRESVTASSANLETRVHTVNANYLGNLELIRKAAAENDIFFVVANQQATSAAPYPRIEAERLKIKGVTYQDEAETIKKRLAAGDNVDSFEYSFLVHYEMMQALQTWASDKQLTFVNVIDALNQDRHYLLSWVHVHPMGNKIIAESLAKPILEKICK